MRKIVALLIIAVLLIGSVFTAQATALPNVWEWIEYVQQNWEYEADYQGELCQEPWVSQERLRGDCDDFAVMVAYYLQESWKYDTYITILHCTNKPDHWVAFLHVSETTCKRMSEGCKAYYPYQTFKGWTYIPIDWELCPTWKWSTCSSSGMYEWNDLVGKPR